MALIITRVLQSWLERQILPRTELEPSLQQSIAAIFGYVGVITAIVLALSQLGIDLQKVALIAGALSVGIGFGLQSIVSNFISGLILLAERPIRVGDLVVVKGEEGYVRRIRVRATEIETFERASVIIPNAEFITGPVKNWTHANTTGRIIVKVGVGYDSDPDAGARHPARLRRRASARAQDPGGAGAAARLRRQRARVRAARLCGQCRCRRSVTRSDLHFAILRRFRAAGIVIPYPQREVRIRKDGESLTKRRAIRRSMLPPCFTADDRLTRGTGDRMIFRSLVGAPHWPPRRRCAAGAGRRLRRRARVAERAELLSQPCRPPAPRSTRPRRPR